MSLTVKIVVFVIVFNIIPTIGLGFYDRYEAQSLRQRIIEDRGECLKDIGESSNLKAICFSSSAQAQEVFQTAMDLVRTTRYVQFSLTFVLAAGILSLSSRVKESEKNNV